jgi:SAM-dependent methyltransferase
MSNLFLERFDFREAYLASRGAKADKILRILRGEIHDPKRASLIDIGCSQGQITQRLAEHFGFVVGVDPEEKGEGKIQAYHFVQADGCKLPIRSSRFDVAVLNHVLEHVSSPQNLLDEVWRVLKPDGVCYLACPNRYSLVEPHYRLPFLSWLPRPLADLYVRLAGRGEKYLDRLPSYWGLKKLVRRFRVTDQTWLVLNNPEEFFTGDPVLKAQVRNAGWLPGWLLRALVPWVPVWILLLKK